MTLLNRLRQQYKDIRTKNDGTYDERSKAGKEANKEVSSAEYNLSSHIQKLTKLLGTYKNSIFLIAAIWAYLLSVIGLAYFQINEMYAPTIAVVVSLLIGFSARSVVAIEINNGELTPKQLPQINRKSFSFLLVIIALMNAFTFSVFIDDDNELRSYFYTDKKQDVIATNSKATESLPDESENEIIPISNKSGFVSYDINALNSPDNHSRTTFIAKGTELLITGEIQGQDLYEVNYSAVNFSLYIPKAAVAVFSE